MATLTSAYGVTRPEALTLLERRGLTGVDGATSLTALEGELAKDIAPRSYGADATRAHAILALHG